MDVPELVTRGDRAAADRWRAGRRALRAELGRLAGPLQVALATDGRVLDTGRQLLEAGAELRGLLAPEPLESLAWAAAAGARRAYPDLRSLLSDEVEVVCVDLDLALGVALARSSILAGLDLVLPRYAVDDASALRMLVRAAQQGEVEIAVALRGRAWPTVPPVLDRLGPLGALRQVTVVGWPIGRAGRIELVDLVRRLCGDVLAVCAAPQAMPAADLRPGEPVTLALLTASGATVLVAETAGSDFADAAVTVVGSDGRIVFGSDFIRRQDARGVASSTAEGSPPSPLAVAVGGLVGVDSSARRNGAAATVGDLLAAVRVLDVAGTSFDVGSWLEL